MLENTNNKINKWLELRDYFKDRTKSPLQHPEFILYFICVIFGFGAIGIWASFFEKSPDSTFYHSNLINNIASFSVAIVASGSIQLFFTENKVLKNSLSFLTLIILGISIVLFIILLNSTNLNFYWLAIPFWATSLCVWWISNADNAYLTQNFFVEKSEKSRDLNESLEDYDEQ